MKKKIAFVFLFCFICSNAFAGTVSGKIEFSGTPPEPQIVDVSADPFCAKKNNGKLKIEVVAVNPNGTLRDVFIYVKKGLESKTFEPSTTPAQLVQDSCHFSPHVFGLQVNQPLEIYNGDATLHNVHGMPKQSKGFNLGMPLQGMKTTKKLDKPEIMVKFKCDVHPWMSAYIGVLPHPFFAVSSETGAYEIKGLPAGTYTLEAWQEKLGTKTQEVTVDETGAATADFSF